MKVILRERQKGEFDLGLIFGGIGLLGFLAARFLQSFTHLLPACPFNSLSGIPCLTCGSTRSGILLAQFQLMDAFLVNPLFVIVSLGIFSWIVVSIGNFTMGKKLGVKLSTGEWRLLRVGLISLFAINWIYLTGTQH